MCCEKKLKLPVKDTKLIELLDCPICRNEVKYEGIFCDTCQSWAHPSCCNLNRSQLKNITNNDNLWSCTACCCPNFTPVKTNLPVKTNHGLTELYETYNDCSICEKTVKSNQSINCGLCKHWVHSRCLKIFKTSEFNKFNLSYKNIDWFCPKCLEDILPCMNMDDHEFQLLCFENQNIFVNSIDMYKKCSQLMKTDMFNKNIFHAKKQTKQ